MQILSINNLSFGYKKQPKLFSGFSLEEKEGQIIGLLGKNGAGKTTLLQLISGLLSPDSGTIEVAGHEPICRKPDFLSQVYLVPEEFFLPAISIRSYVQAMAPVYPTFDKEKMETLLDKFELDYDQNLNKISHGQKKKFRIAFALSTGCKLIVLDEPTNGLDIPSKAIFRQVVASSIKEDQLVIISTHQVKDVESLIDKIILVSKGKVIFNEHVLTISDRYAFKTVNTLFDDVLYHEVHPSGFKVIVPSNGETTEVDMEVLFNAVHNGAILNS